MFIISVKWWSINIHIYQRQTLYQGLFFFSLSIKSYRVSYLHKYSFLSVYATYMLGVHKLFFICNITVILLHLKYKLDIYACASNLLSIGKLYIHSFFFLFILFFFFIFFNLFCFQGIDTMNHDVYAILRKQNTYTTRALIHKN